MVKMFDITFLYVHVLYINAYPMSSMQKKHNATGVRTRLTRHPGRRSGRLSCAHAHQLHGATHRITTSCNAQIIQGLEGRWVRAGMFFWIFRKRYQKTVCELEHGP